MFLEQKTCIPETGRRKPEIKNTKNQVCCLAVFAIYRLWIHVCCLCLWFVFGFQFELWGLWCLVIAVYCLQFTICCCNLSCAIGCCLLFSDWSYDECSLSLAICIAICKFCCLWFVGLGCFVLLCRLLFAVHSGCCVVFILCNLSVWRLKLLLCCSRKKQSPVCIPKLPINTPQMSFTNPQTVCANCTITSPQQCSHKH